MMWMHGWGGYGGGSMFGGGPFMFFFWIVLLGLAVWGLWRVLPMSGGYNRDALKSLEERYARGEIDKAVVPLAVV